MKVRGRSIVEQLLIVALFSSFAWLGVECQTNSLRTHSQRIVLDGDGGVVHGGARRGRPRNMQDQEDVSKVPPTRSLSSKKQGKKSKREPKPSETDAKNSGSMSEEADEDVSTSEEPSETGGSDEESIEDTEGSTANESGTEDSGNEDPSNSVTASPSMPSMSSQPMLNAMATTLPLAEFNNTSKIPLCQVDANGFYIPPNDPRSMDPNTVTRASDSITFEDVIATQDNINTALDGIGGLAGAGATLFATYATSFATLAAAGTVASMVINIAGLGGPSKDDIILDRIQQGFEKLDEKLTMLQREIREGLLDLSILIGDIALDEISAALDSISRSFSDYANATSENREVLYGPRLRAVCNEPFKTPQDLFYNLYGYVCESCEFASRKRADLLDSAITQSNNSTGPTTSASTFLATFGNFILRSMTNAFLFHTMCPPPMAGSCIDHTNDMAWANGIQNMNLSFIEAAARVTNESDSLSNWVENMSVSTLDPFLTGDTTTIANRIAQLLGQSQPDFFIQVIVAKRDDLDSNYLVRGGCEKSDTEKCSTIRDRTGHFWFYNIKDMDVQIRYRLKALGPPNTLFTLTGQEPQPFADWYIQYAVDTLGAFPGPYRSHADKFPQTCPPVLKDRSSVVFQWAACLVPICILCDEAQTTAFSMTVSSDNYFVHRLRDFPEREPPWSELAVSYTTSDAERNQIFPSVDVRFLKGTDDDDPYRFFFV